MQSKECRTIISFHCKNYGLVCHSNANQRSALFVIPISAQELHCAPVRASVYRLCLTLSDWPSVEKKQIFSCTDFPFK